MTLGLILLLAGLAAFIIGLVTKGKTPISESEWMNIHETVKQNANTFCRICHRY